VRRSSRSFPERQTALTGRNWRTVPTFRSNARDPASRQAHTDSAKDYTAALRDWVANGKKARAHLPVAREVITRTPPRHAEAEARPNSSSGSICGRTTARSRAEALA